MLKRRGYACFSSTIVVREHPEKKNPKEELLLVDPRNSSSPKFVNSQWNDYNKRTNASFVYQSTSLEYYEPIED